MMGRTQRLIEIVTCDRVACPVVVVGGESESWAEVEQRAVGLGWWSEGWDPDYDRQFCPKHSPSKR